MRPLSTLAIALPIAALLALTGCGSGTPTTPAQTAAPGATSAPVPATAATAPASTGSKVTVNGTVLTGKGAQIHCQVADGAMTFGLVDSVSPAHRMVTASGSVNEAGTEVTLVNIVTTGGNPPIKISVFTGPAGGGEAAVTKSGSTYTITGKGDADQGAEAPTFEIVADCS